MEFAFSNLPGHEGRRGLYMHTFRGKAYFPCDPRLEEVCIEDIAHHLSMQCRFAGATIDFVSVAEHSYLCSMIEGEGISPQDQLEALMHDAAEAYIQDFIRPIKYLPEFRTIYGELERLNESVIAEKFSLRYPWSKHVKRCDETVCTLEVEDNIASREKGHLHQKLPVPANLKLLRLLPCDAKALFLDRFHELRARISQLPEVSILDAA